MSTPASRKQLRGLIRFWKTEASQWRKLYEKQRGGEAFDALQTELAAARMRIHELERQH